MNLNINHDVGTTNDSPCVKATAKSQIHKLKLRKTELRERVAEIQAEISASCIAGRNEYSRGAIQRDFAAGIKELYQADQDEETFNPDEELHDYEKMGAELKVFCVSSRAYQKMCGRLKKDKAVPGFTKVAETEVWRLCIVMRHILKFTDTPTAGTCNRAYRRRPDRGIQQVPAGLYSAIEFLLPLGY